jgi:hypothetical protein
MFQLLVRKTVIIVYGPVLEDLYCKRFYFWKHDLYGKIKGKEFRRRMASCISLIKCLWSMGVFSITFHSAAPFFIESLVLPHSCWIPGDNFVIRIILHCMETIFYIETALLVGVFDQFYLLMCTELKIQFDLLSKTIRSINIGASFCEAHEEICWKKLKHCSKYHNFLLG